MRVIIFGSSGLVGKSLTNVLQLSDKVDFLFPSTREDTNLEELDSIRKVIEENKPDYIVNCAAKVGGIHANNTYRADFLIDNLKINLNLYEVLKDFKNVNIINLEVAVSIL